MDNLFGQNEYNPIDSTDLTKYLLDNFPETKTSVEEFKKKFYGEIIKRSKDREDAVRLLMIYEVHSALRRRLELV